MSWIFTFLKCYGLPAMLLMILLEYACFPISSEIVLPFCGALAESQEVFFPLLILLSSAAGLIGTSLCYLAGRLGGTPLLEKLMCRFPKTRPGLERSFGYFHRLGPVLVLVGRFIPLCRTYLGFVAGALALPLRQYLPFSFLGILCWNTLLCGFGYFLGSRWPVVSSWYTRYKNILLPCLLLTALFLIYHFRCRHAKKTS